MENTSYFSTLYWKILRIAYWQKNNLNEKKEIVSMKKSKHKKFSWTRINSFVSKKNQQIIQHRKHAQNSTACNTLNCGDNPHNNKIFGPKIHFWQKNSYFRKIFWETWSKIPTALCQKLNVICKYLRGINHITFMIFIALL